MLRHKQNKAQSTAEYVIVLGLIVAAVMAMQTYVKRGFQGRIKDAVDYTDAGGSNLTFNTKQYEPYYLHSNFESGRNTLESENLLTGGAVDRTSNLYTTKNGAQQIGEVVQE